MSMTIQAPRFGLPCDTGGKDLGIFLPIANGGWILSSTTPPLDASYEYNRMAALPAEEIGLDFIMSIAKSAAMAAPPTIGAPRSTAWC